MPWGRPPGLRNRQPWALSEREGQGESSSPSFSEVSGGPHLTETVPLRRPITLFGCFTCLQSQNSVAQNTGTWLFFFFFKLAKRDIILVGFRNGKEQRMFCTV